MRHKAPLTAALAALTIATCLPNGLTPPPTTAVPAVVSIAGQPRDLSDLEAIEARAGSSEATDAAVAALLNERLASFPVVDGAHEVLQDSDLLDNLDTGELMKMVQLAHDEGRPVGSVIRQHGLQDEFERVADDLRIQYPDTFAGSHINRPDGSAWFAFVGDVPEQARARLAALHAPSEVVTGMRHSLESLEQVAWRITSGLEVKAGAGVSQEDQAIEVTLAEATPGQRALAADKARRIAAAAGVEVRIDDTAGGVASHDGYARGGSNLRGHNSSGDYYGCTMGFVMRTGSGAYRMGSAGHCHPKTWQSTRMILRSMDGGTSSYIKNTIAWEDSTGDIGLWTLGTFKPMAVFYAKSTMKSSVRGWIRYPSVGSSVCKFGSSSGFTCDVINNSSWSWMGLGQLVRTRNDKSHSGDSGGPWFSGNTAYGVHMGSATFLQDDIFTRLNGFALHDTKVMIYG